jgi:hypothetical protein
MGAEGLQVSEDNGQTFHQASLGSGHLATGSAAISPGFNENDPSILIGAEALTRYRDDQKTLEPVPSTSGTGPFEPTYSPSYTSDRVVFLGGIRLDPVAGTVASVYRCLDAVCTASSLDGQLVPPKIRIGPTASARGKIYAFTQDALFVSEDGRAFSPVQLGWEEDLRELVIDNNGRLVATTIPLKASGLGGVYLSDDGGVSWTAAKSELLSGGAVSVATWGNRIIVGLADRGVACSSDGGVTWTRRCKRN